MYCKNCGAAVVGKFCSSCGTRVRSDLQEYSLAESRVRRQFINSCYKATNDLALQHLATACWYAASLRYGKGAYIMGQLAPDAFEILKTVKEHASALFKKLLVLGF